MAKRKSSENPAEAPASFEESLGELQAIVTELEDGTLGLETSLARFERGVGLLRACYSILEAAEAKVEILTRFQDDGGVVTAPFESSATLEAARERQPRLDNPDSSSGDGDCSVALPEESAKSSLF